MKPYLILLAFLLAATSVVAQRNVPVAGQASILYDLLKKDYSSIDPDLVGDQLIADRAQVISIFRSFAIKPHYFRMSADAEATMDSAKSKAIAYNTRKKVANAASITTVSAPNDGVANAVNIANEKRITNQETARAAYYDAKYKADDLQLSELQQDYADEGNTFVSDVIGSFIDKYEAVNDGQGDGLATSGTGSVVNKALPVFGAFGNSTEIIDGISKFLAKRIKEELTTFAVQNIQDWLNKNRYKVPTEELLTLFPATADYITHFDADKVTNFPNEIKQYIENDLNNLMDNAYLLQNTTYFKALIQHDLKIQLAFEAFHLVPQLTKMKNPADFITLLNTSKIIPILETMDITTHLPHDEVSYNIGTSLSFLELMSNSLTVTTNGEPQYTTVDFWSNYGREFPFLELYVGFLRQQNLKYYTIDFYLKNTHYQLEDWLSPIVTKTGTYIAQINQLQPIVTDICKNAESIYDQAQNLKKLNNAGQKIGADTIFSFNKSVIDFASDLGTDADQIMAAFKPLGVPASAIASGIKPYINAADTANEAVKNILDKKYAAGIIELLQLGFSFGPQNQLPQTMPYAQYQSLSKLTATNLAEWLQVSNLILQPATPTAADLAAAHVLAGVLASVYNGYDKLNNKQSKVEKLIDDAGKDLLALKGQSSDASLLKKLDVIWKDERFEQAVIDYYSGFVLIDGLANLYKRMGEPLQSGSGDQTPAFSSKDIKNLQQDIGDYFSLAFDVKIEQQAGLGGKLTTIEGTVTTTISGYATQLSGVFGHQLDSRIVSLIHFINDMALAKNSDDVEAAIEALALPAGSYSIKQKSVYTLTVNAFPGIIGGVELTNGHKVAGSIGFTAPVGLNFTKGRIWRNWTLGLFVPLIDVGAVTRLRLDRDSSTQTLPNLTWKNVFSPGAYITIGIGKTPFSINLGAQYGPEVQDIKTGVTHPSWRVGAGFTLDIPFFNIYNKPYSY